MTDKDKSDKRLPSSQGGASAPGSMKTLGDYLQSERLKQGLSLEELSSITGIRVGLLKALEENNRDELPAEVFVQGFIKILSKRLDLDFDMVSTLYSQGMQGRDIETADDINVHGIVRLKTSDREPIFSSYRVYTWLISSILLILACYMGYQIYQGQTAVKDSPETTSAVEETGWENSLPAIEENLQTDQTIAVDNNSSPVAEAELPIEEQTRTELESIPKKEVFYQGSPVVNDYYTDQEFNYVLKALFTEMTWLELSLDKKPSREFTFRPGERRVWMAQESIDLHIGNAGGIELTLNDMPLPKLGGSRETVRLSIPIDKP